MGILEALSDLAWHMDSAGSLSRSFAGRPVRQVAYVVTDVRSAVARWEQRMGAGPFVVREHIPVFDVVHRGVRSAFDHTSAYGQWGEVMVELFTQHGNNPSAVRDRFAEGETGLHHLAIFCEPGSLDAELSAFDAQGWPLAMIATTGSPEEPGQRFAMVDAVADLGHFIEVYEATDRLVSFYAMVRESARVRMSPDGS